MSKSIEEQISNRCVYFNGAMNSCCKKAVQYADVRFDRPYKFPCLNEGGECVYQQFPTPSEVADRVAKIDGNSQAALAGIMAIKAEVKDGKTGGSVPCKCGGKLMYSVAEINGHVRAKCDSCGI